MAVLTINSGDTITLAGVAYTVSEVGPFQPSLNTTQLRLGIGSAMLHLKKVGAGPQPSDYINPALKNAGGRP